jgi:hypothetical protein
VAEPARPSRQCFRVASAHKAARSESRRTGSELRRKNAPQNEILVGGPQGLWRITCSRTSRGGGTSDHTRQTQSRGRAAHRGPTSPRGAF